LPGDFNFKTEGYAFECIQIFDETTFMIQARYRSTKVHFTFYTIDERQREDG
jgi:hypothetical protein